MVECVRLCWCKKFLHSWRPWWDSPLLFKRVLQESCWIVLFIYYWALYFKSCCKLKPLAESETCRAALESLRQWFLPWFYKGWNHIVTNNGYLFCFVFVAIKHKPHLQTCRNSQDGHRTKDLCLLNPPAASQMELPVIIYNCWPLFTDRKDFWRCFPRSQKAQSPPFFPWCLLQISLDYFVKIISWLNCIQIQPIL